MHLASLAASGVLAHAVHIGLIVVGLIGVVVLLLPGWRATRSAGTARDWSAPATEEEHRARVDDLRVAMSSLQ